MKVFTLAAAINEGVYNGKEYFQSGKYAVGSSDIKDHNGGFDGDLLHLMKVLKDHQM